MKIFINYDSSSDSYQVKYHKCNEDTQNLKNFIVYKSYLIDRREPNEFGNFFLRLLERRNACSCGRDSNIKGLQSVEISAKEYKRIRNKK